MIVLVITDQRDFDVLVIGPFASEENAFRWAQQDAKTRFNNLNDHGLYRPSDFRLEEDQPHNYIAIFYGDDTGDIVYDWQVTQVISPR